MYAVKSCVDSSYKALTLFFYVLLLVTWGYCRLWVFPQLVYKVYTSSELLYTRFYDRGHFSAVVHFGFVFFLGVLFLLHIYWYSLFLKMGWSFIKTGKTADSQQKVDRFDEVKPSKSATANAATKSDDKIAQASQATVADSSVISRRAKSRRD